MLCLCLSPLAGMPRMRRSYRTDDVEEVIAVWEAATRVAHPFLSDAFLAAERDNLRNLYLPHTETTVWEVDDADGDTEGRVKGGGRVVGFIALICGEEGVEIGGLFVDPSRHRQGIGRALLRHAREEKGELEVEVFEANPIGRAFYAGQGFEPIGRSTHEATGQEVLRLRLPATTA